MKNSITNIDFCNEYKLPYKELLKLIIGLFSIPDVPPPPIDPLSILDAVKNPGLSPRKIAARIIARQSEACAPFGPLPSGSANVAEKMELIRVEEMVKAIQQDLRITVSVPPGIIINGTAISPAGPLPVVGTTVSPAHSAPAIAQ